MSVWCISIRSSIYRDIETDTVSKRPAGLVFSSLRLKITLLMRWALLCTFSDGALPESHDGKLIHSTEKSWWKMEEKVRSCFVKDFFSDSLISLWDWSWAALHLLEILLCYNISPLLLTKPKKHLLQLHLPNPPCSCQLLTVFPEPNRAHSHSAHPDNCSLPAVSLWTYFSSLSLSSF